MLNILDLLRQLSLNDTVCVCGVCVGWFVEINVVGLECEEAMSVIRGAIRRNNLTTGNQLLVITQSPSFTTLLTKWAVSLGHHLELSKSEEFIHLLITLRG